MRQLETVSVREGHGRASGLPIDAGRARGYALATNDDNPRYQRAEIAPPMFASVLGGVAIVDLYRQLFPSYPDVDIIHLSSDLTFYRPLVPGTTIDADASVVALRRNATGGILTLANAVRDPDGELLVEAFATILVPVLRGAAEFGDPAPEPRVPALRKARSLQRRSAVIDRDMPLRFSAASGDYQAIHLDDAAAQAVGLARAVLHGGCTMALCAAAAVDLVAGRDPARLARVALRFSQPVYPGSQLVIDISEPVERDGLACHAVRAECEGRPVIRGGRVEVRP